MDAIVQTLASFLNGERAVIIVLVGLIAYIMLQKRVDPKKSPDEKDAPPTEEEFKQMLAEFKPEPLIPPSEKYASMLPIDPLIVSGPPTATIQVGDKPCLNLATTNFLGFATHPKITEAAKNALQKYGCGACGPRGFYGTIDVHDHLEKHLAKFFGTEEAILYPSAYATMSSIIPTFAARADLLVVDEAVSHSIRLGVELSRAEVLYYHHNDMKHLEEVLQKVKEEDARGKRKLTRRFIIFEGLSFNSGEIAPVKQIVELKEKYCFRVMMDDSYAIGVLGKTGHGSLEYHGIAPKTIEMISGSLGHSLGSSAGFCAGSYASVYHQRLNSSGYVFSASPPPYLVVAANTALAMLDDSQTSEKLINDLRARANQLRAGLSRLSGVSVLGSIDSPIVHVRLAKQRTGARLDDEKFWQQIVDQSREVSSLAITRAHYNPDEKKMPAPGLRLTVCAQHSAADIDRAINALSQHIKSALQ